MFRTILASFALLTTSMIKDRRGSMVDESCRSPIDSMNYVVLFYDHSLVLFVICGKKRSMPIPPIGVRMSLLYKSRSVNIFQPKVTMNFNH